LQLATSRSQAEAQALWKQVSSTNAQLAGKGPAIEQVDIGNFGTFYSLKVGPFPDKAESSKVCNALKRNWVVPVVTLGRNPICRIIPASRGALGHPSSSEGAVADQREVTGTPSRPAMKPIDKTTIVPKQRAEKPRRGDLALYRGGACLLAFRRTASRLFPHRPHRRRRSPSPSMWCGGSSIWSMPGEVLPQNYLPDTYLPSSWVCLIIGIFTLMVVGALTANLFGRTIVSYGEMMLDHMPVVRGVYRLIKQSSRRSSPRAGPRSSASGSSSFPAAVSMRWCFSPAIRRRRLRRRSAATIR
jgi:hypothetical protein